MKFRYYIATVIFLAFSACTKFEDAETTSRSTFVHFFSSENNYEGVVAELDSDGGFIVSGKITKENGETDALIIKTDARGHRIWETIIPKGIINGIKPSADGYVLVGDSIQLNSGSSQASLSELENSYGKLLFMDRSGTVVAQHTSTGSVRIGNDTLTVDYHGNAFAFDSTTGHIIMLGSYRIPGQHEKTFVSAFDPASIADSVWLQRYESLDHDLFNCDAVYVTRSSDLVWASRLFTQQENVSRQFVGVSRVRPNSTFKTYTQYGESDSRNHSVEDLQRSSVGYCAIGTYSDNNGANGNIYFIRFDSNLGLMPGSARYFDGEELMLNDAALADESITVSGSIDEGLAVTATNDGFVLAGTLTSTPTVGNGGTDILLIKLDPFGNLLWKKLIGGSGDETVTSIRVTSDNGLLLCGTNTMNGLSTIMILRTDMNGDVNN